MRKFNIMTKKQRQKIERLHANTLSTFAAIIDEMQCRLILDMRAGFGLDKCSKEMREAAKKLRKKWAE